MYCYYHDYNIVSNLISGLRVYLHLERIKLE